ncbi:type I 3-dehydroquinate dehydratase [Cellulomonas fimi]|uniref:3-dehydroquinate dehydratase n=1 Tax=Cellulomonas fimi TaxID=1708 RepID=A0A7Y0QGQ2_CELFI|nr:type I 3-dehydroquinate dehydratase [Cellulomonas fimi]
MTVGDVTLSCRDPRIIVPLTAADAAGLDAEVAAALDGGADLVEWRVDHFTSRGDVDAVAAQCRALADRLGAVPLLATVRTAAEGGATVVTDDEYLTLVRALCERGAARLVDVEYRQRAAATAIDLAHANGVLVVASNHDFEATPAEDDLVERLATMERMGADVAKVAVMPRSMLDVHTLLRATTVQFARARVPLITMSMGRLGLISRLSGQLFGSCATFATAGAASAPGQVPVADARAAFDLLRRLGGGPVG